MTIVCISSLPGFFLSYQQHVREVMIISSTKKKPLLPLFCFLFFLTVHDCCSAVNIITPTQSITDSQTITSSGEIFRLGFFSLGGNSKNRYVGIWYNKIPRQNIVWVANRENPLKGSSGALAIANDGNLAVLDGQRDVLWSTNVSNIAGNSTIAELLDSGNLVVREVLNDRRILWQSFDHPSDTFLPTMKVGANMKTGETQMLTAWKGESDPSVGRFFAGIDLINIPQMVIWNGSHRHWRSGPWNNRIFIGDPTMYSVYLDGFYINRDAQEDTVSMTFNYANRSSFSKYVLNYRGELLGGRWDEGRKEWVQFWSTPNDECDVYSKCGPFGSCNMLDSPMCSCLRGFSPKSKEEWSKGNWSGGCVRKTELQCERNSNTTYDKEKEDGFLKLEMMKVPDFAFWFAPKNVKDCEHECFKNCSCLAFAYDDGVGCMLWGGNLVDIQKFNKAGVDLYIRVASSELDEKENAMVIIIITVVVGTCSFAICTYCSWRCIAKHRGKKKEEMEITLFDRDGINKKSSDSIMLGETQELNYFNFEKLVIATNNFSGEYKLGEGGFGSVYKGTLPDGHEIAVKRLSKSSTQGLEEFKNEVLVISKLQHRNLVKLLGCCTEREEKMLIYEYMPNKSLDAFLFDPTKRALLVWSKRFKIIEGIGRGILYLHRDSRLKVIHRDLKASNILLDEELHPKISDFGMARIFGGNELQEKTSRVVGTYGYMAPEYAMQGQFSEKSDVFSFGVLLLEIVSGEKNTSFYHHRQSTSLLGYAWELWNENRMWSFIDPMLSEPCFEEEILRCIHVGLLCVQELAKDRPTVSNIVSMLTGSEIDALPTPKRPAFTEQVTTDIESSQNMHRKRSSNVVTITTLEGR